MLSQHIVWQLLRPYVATIATVKTRWFPNEQKCMYGNEPPSHCAVGMSATSLLFLPHVMFKLRWPCRSVWHITHSHKILTKQQKNSTLFCVFVFAHVYTYDLCDPPSRTLISVTGSGMVYYAPKMKMNHQYLLHISSHHLRINTYQILCPWLCHWYKLGTVRVLIHVKILWECTYPREAVADGNWQNPCRSSIWLANIKVQTKWQWSFDERYQVKE